MNLLQLYREKTLSILSSTLESQEDLFVETAKSLLKVVTNNKIIHVFGTGHSHIIAEEAFYRAGGLACINAMLEPSLMLHDGVEQSSWLERVEGLASVILDKYRVQPGDAIIIISNSGRNPVPIEMAIESKKRGLFTVGITSLHYRGEKSRHMSGKKLFEVVDTVFDNGSVIGDAIVEIASGVCMGPTSTIVGCAIVNSLFLQIAQEMTNKQLDPPVIQSTNVDRIGVQERNHELIEQYRSRVRYF